MKKDWSPSNIEIFNFTVQVSLNVCCRILLMQQFWHIKRLQTRLKDIHTNFIWKHAKLSIKRLLNNVGRLYFRIFLQRPFFIASFCLFFCSETTELLKFMLKPICHNQMLLSRDAVHCLFIRKRNFLLIKDAKCEARPTTTLTFKPICFADRFS